MLIQTENINPVVVLTEHAHRLEHLLWQTGLLTVTTSEGQFDFMLRLTELSHPKL